LALLNSALIAFLFINGAKSPKEYNDAGDLNKKDVLKALPAEIPKKEKTQL
jgi:hypothetical protein